jgi:hypothetical protein
VVATNRKHPNPAVRCRGNLRRSGRRGCQTIIDLLRFIHNLIYTWII